MIQEADEFKDDDDFLLHVVDTDATPQDVERFHRIITSLKSNVIERESQLIKAKAFGMRRRQSWFSEEMFERAWTLEVLEGSV